VLAIEFSRCVLPDDEVCDNVRNRSSRLYTNYILYKQEPSSIDSCSLKVPESCRGGQGVGGEVMALFIACFSAIKFMGLNKLGD